MGIVEKGFVGTKITVMLTSFVPKDATGHQCGGGELELTGIKDRLFLEGMFDNIV